MSGFGGKGDSTVLTTTRELQTQLDAPLPETDISVSLSKLDGRGDVELIQAPSASKRYTAIVRIRDESDRFSGPPACSSGE